MALIAPFLFLCLLSPSLGLPKVNLTEWLEFFERRFASHPTRRPVVLPEPWKAPCEAPRTRRSALSPREQREFYADSLARRAKELHGLLTRLRAESGGARLPSAFRALFRSVRLPGLPAPSRGTWPSPPLLQQLDDGFGRLAVYVQLLGAGLLHTAGQGEALERAQRAEQLVLGLLCHLHVFAWFWHPQTRLRWPSAQLTTAAVVLPFWRRVRVPVQKVGDLRAYLICRDGAEFVESFRKTIS